MYGMTRLLVLLALLIAAPVSAQPCPGFPARGVQIIDALYNPGLAFGSDDDRRALTRTFIEQMVFEMPSDGWTWKSADPGRPPSKDSIAKLAGGRLCNYDWQNGGTRQRQVQPGTIGEDITGQNPIHVAGVNHLSDVPNPGTPAPVPGIPPAPVPIPTLDLSGLSYRLDSLTAQIERMYADYVARDNRLSAQVSMVDQKVEQVKEKEGPIEATFTNRYVQIIGAAIAAWATAQATK
jgi:hypothetical protein